MRKQGGFLTVGLVMVIIAGGIISTGLIRIGLQEKRGVEIASLRGYADRLIGTVRPVFGSGVASTTISRRQAKLTASGFLASDQVFLRSTVGPPMTADVVRSGSVVGTLTDNYTALGPGYQPTGATDGGLGYAGGIFGIQAVSAAWTASMSASTPIAAHASQANNWYSGVVVDWSPIGQLETPVNAWSAAHVKQLCVLYVGYGANASDAQAAAWRSHGTPVWKIPNASVAASEQKPEGFTLRYLSSTAPPVGGATPAIQYCR